MILCIDVGNTNTVFGVMDNGVIIKQWRVVTPGDPMVQSWESTESQGLHVDGAIICSVVPRCDASLTRFCVSQFGQDPHFVTADNAQIPIRLDHPKQIGADRIVNAAGVIAHYQPPAIVIDFGTATTFDVIDGNNTYCGGIIAPGIRLSLKALTDAAAQLDTVAIEKPPQAIGTNTAHAIQSGLFYGYKGVIEGCVAEISQELKAQPTVIATGGLGRLFINETDTIHTYDPDLTLKGLANLYTTLAS